jgi:hypothetical protein
MFLEVIMKARINNYDPETGFCDIVIGNRVYELEGIDQVITDHNEHENAPRYISPIYKELLATPGIFHCLIHSCSLMISIPKGQPIIYQAFPGIHIVALRLSPMFLRGRLTMVIAWGIVV